MPYHGSHAIYLWEGCNDQGIYINEITESIVARLLSLRAFGENHLMLQADICKGADMKMLLKFFFDYPSVGYIHIHNAKQGGACLAECFLDEPAILTLEGKVK